MASDIYAKVSVFIVTSLDGYIARPDGRIDWLEKANATVPQGEDCGYQKFFDSVDALVMGRKTYRKREHCTFIWTGAAPFKASWPKILSTKSRSREFRSCWVRAFLFSVRFQRMFHGLT